MTKKSFFWKSYQNKQHKKSNGKIIDNSNKQINQPTNQPTLFHYNNTMSSNTTTNNNEIPTEMKRLIVSSPGDGTSLKECKVVVETLPTPTPASGEVLIKVCAAPVNPSDYGSWMRNKTYPMPMGKEGCGIVVATSGLWASFKCPLGTKVGFVVMDIEKQGSYSEYVTANVMKAVFSMPNDVPVEDCASFFVNPYTAVGILDIAKNECNAKVLVATAAASQLGQMLNKLAPSENMEILNVVRREEQAELLREIGAKHIVVTINDESEWKTELKAKIDELGATCAFDAVAGSMVGTLMDVLPHGSTVYNYGVLSGNISGINPIDLIYRKKKLKGFYLTSWIMNGGMLSTLRRLSSAASKVNSGLNGGWSSSQFEDVAPEETFDKILDLLGTKSTGIKLRIRFDKE